MIFHYFLRPVGEWGPEPHAAEPWLIGVHGAFVFLALGLVGALGVQHFAKAWAAGRRRVTGLLLAGWLATMVLSGWLLLYGPGGSDALVSPIHWVAGLSLPVAYLSHRLWRRRQT